MHKDDPDYNFFFFNATAPPEIYTLSLHDALPISPPGPVHRRHGDECGDRQSEVEQGQRHERRDRKSTRLNSSHVEISYAVFCLKKKMVKVERDRRVRSLEQLA